MKTITMLFCAILLMICGCIDSNKTPQKKTIATTIWPLTSIVEFIVDGKIEVINVLDPDLDPHSYVLSTEDLKRMGSVVICFKVGRGLDDWVTKTAESGNNCEIVDLSQNCPEVSVPIHHGDHAHHHHQQDPHLWMDPVIVKEHWVPKILERLVTKFPEHKEFFNNNSQRFIEQLTKLDSQTREKLQDIQNRNIILLHSSLVYFAKRYDFNTVAVIEPWPGKDITNKLMVGIIELTKKNPDVMILYEPQLKDKAMRIAKNVESKTLEIYPLGNFLNQKNFPGYQELISQNAEILSKGLK